MKRLLLAALFAASFAPVSFAHDADKMPKPHVDSHHGWQKHDKKAHHPMPKVKHTKPVPADTGEENLP